jgi:hypothetical protein
MVHGGRGVRAEIEWSSLSGLTVLKTLSTWLAYVAAWERFFQQYGLTPSKAQAVGPAGGRSQPL